MLKKIAATVMSIAGIIGLWSCTSGTTYQDNYYDYLVSSVELKSFSLVANNEILENLDSVYFSIDLQKATAFNADSLPKGTRVNALLVSLTYTAASKVELKFKSIYNTDTVIEYKSETTDSINFANGPVTLSITSLDGKTVRDYQLKVNVHNVELDTLVWSESTHRKLPTTFAEVKEQKTVMLGNDLYCLTTDGSAYCMAVSDSPLEGWETSAVNFGFAPDVRSLAATESAMFILDVDGNLYKSTNGKSWASTGEVWESITGPYVDSLLGVKKTNGLFYNTCYPDGPSTVMADNFPAYGSSTTYIYNNIWAPMPQAIIVGGRTTDGKIIGNTWAYDGKNWANITASSQLAAEGISMFPYYVCTTPSSNWRTKTTSVLMAIGGKKADGTNNKTLYVSKDLGFNWEQADSLMQLPPFIPALNNADVVVFDRKFGTTSKSRAVAPITSWNVPFIFMFGGVDSAGKLEDSVWNGVVTNLTFKPLQ